MEVNAIKIKQHRTDLSWTQQQLADACDVSLRTIQRVERYGTASNETVMALAAVFELNKLDIVVPEEPVEVIHQQRKSKTPLAQFLIAGLVGSAWGAAIMYLVMA